MEEPLDISAVADAIASAVIAPPPPLPQGWILKESRSQPGYHYYYNLETGVCSWNSPMENLVVDSTVAESNMMIRHENPQAPLPQSTSRPLEETPEPAEANGKPPKRRKTSAPTQVRVLHILKKHKDSRRPSSWRKPVISQTLEESRAEVGGLLEILQEEENNPEELQATFEELARTESDCSSAKRGGDLGFFGRRKMQPAFEEAAFGLEIGELTKELVETSSGVHVLLRIG
jgi:NIMA-interacting peptidyl-prolyl cis-trans isomerase 1